MGYIFAAVSPYHSINISFCVEKNDKDFNISFNKK